MKINWITIFVNNFEESKQFYGGYLGMASGREFSPGNGVTIAFFGGENETKIELIHDSSVKAEAKQNNIAIGVSSKHYDRLLVQAREQGIVCGEPTVLGGYLECFYVLDPNGISIQIAREKIPTKL